MNYMYMYMGYGIKIYTHYCTVNIIIYQMMVNWLFIFNVYTAIYDTYIEKYIKSFFKMFSN